MLVSCPECARQVSERAAACPGCGFPIAAELASATSQRTSDRQARARVGAVDCPSCAARGFRELELHEPDGRTVRAFDWCERCEHTGRIVLVRSERGFYAVSEAMLDPFVAGTIDEGEHATFIGTTAPSGHRYPAPGSRADEESG
jgi:hypothetical protein